MSKDYVTEENGAYRIAKTRVSLDSVVYAFWEGMSPESIVDRFPGLRLEEVYGAIAYYLAHQAEVDAYLRQEEEEFAALSKRLKEQNAWGIPCILSMTWSGLDKFFIYGL